MKQLNIEVITSDICRAPAGALQISGKVAANEYASFVSSIYCPIDGSHIAVKANIKDRIAVDETKELRMMLNEELINSKFYKYSSRLIKEAALRRVFCL